MAGAIAITNIAKWNGSSWSALNSGANSTVRSLTLQEYLAGTDPRSALSALRITKIQRNGLDLYIDFATSTNKLYRLDFNSDIVVTGTWNVLTNNVLSTGGLVTVIDPLAAALPKRFYRVKLLP